MDDLIMSMNLCLGLAMSAMISMGPRPAVGYLAKLGAAPMRFQAPPRAPEELAPLPPLAMTNPPPPPPEDFGPPAPPENTATVVEAVTPAPAPVAQAAPTAENGMGLTPQMLIQFFNEKRGTNQDFNVVVPYQFTPPPSASIPAPPSRATYTVK
jgi:hypothetical protein